MLTKTVKFEFPLHLYRQLPLYGCFGARSKFITEAIIEKLERDKQKEANK